MATPQENILDDITQSRIHQDSLGIKSRSAGFDSRTLLAANNKISN
jgi:hypothetical protein